MDKPTFLERLETARAANKEKNIVSQTAYRNGQILLGDDDVSNWDNFDRYFKFYNIHP